MQCPSSLAQTALLRLSLELTEDRSVHFTTSLSLETEGHNGVLLMAEGSASFILQDDSCPAISIPQINKAGSIKHYVSMSR